MLERTNAALIDKSNNDGSFDRFQQWFTREHLSAREFVFLFALAVLAHIYFITNFSLSIDDELAAVRSDASVWLAQGRFTMYAVEGVLFPQPATSFSPYLVLAVCQVLAYMLIVRSHGMLPSWKSYASFLLFATFPAWWAISEFAANVPGTGLGLLLVAIAVYLQHMPETPGRGPLVRRLGLASFVLALAAGAYQSLLLFHLTASAGIALYRSLGMRGDWHAVLRMYIGQAMHTGLVLVVAASMYFALNKGLQILLNVAPAYVGGLVHPELLRDMPYWLFGNIAKHMLDVYTGSAAIYGSAMPAAVLFMGMTVAVIATVGRRHAPLHLLMFACVLGAPFLLNVLAGPDAMPMRSQLALSYVVWLCAIVLISQTRAWWLVLACTVLGLYQLQILNLISQYIASTTIAQGHDRAIAQDIAKEILALQPETVSGQVRIDFYGSRPIHSQGVYRVMSKSATNASFFGWDSGNLERIGTYMSVLGVTQFVPADQETRRKLTPEFATMPVWPHPGAIKLVGSVALVKIGADADAGHTPNIDPQ